MMSDVLFLLCSNRFRHFASEIYTFCLFQFRFSNKIRAPAYSSRAESLGYDPNYNHRECAVAFAVAVAAGTIAPALLYSLLLLQHLPFAHFVLLVWKLAGRFFTHTGCYPQKAFLYHFIFFSK